MAQNKTLIQRIDWPVSGFLFGVPLVALITTPIYLTQVGWNWPVWVFAILFAAATEMSVTAGYHRYFAHRSYESHPVLQWFLVAIATSGWQGSVLRWCAGHRTHHRFIDTEQDPYAITKGFWFAHMGWMLMKEGTPKDFKNCPDLEKQAWLRFQDRFYVPLAILSGFGFPTLVGYAMGDLWGGLLIGGFLRIAVTQQFTYFVNSLAHTLGRRPYTLKNSARDSFWVALLTYGEGYHNFHHCFQADYRNGVRWFEWDPTKWMIWSFSKVGLTQRLRRISKEEILKARLQVDAQTLQSKGFSQAKLDQMYERIMQASQRLRELQAQYKNVALAKYNLEKAHFEERKVAFLEQKAKLRTELELARLEFRFALRQWKTHLRSPVPV